MIIKYMYVQLQTCMQVYTYLLPSDSGIFVLLPEIPTYHFIPIFLISSDASSSIYFGYTFREFCASVDTTPPSEFAEADSFVPFSFVPFLWLCSVFCCLRLCVATRSSVGSWVSISFSCLHSVQFGQLVRRTLCFCRLSSAQRAVVRPVWRLRVLLQLLSFDLLICSPGLLCSCVRLFTSCFWLACRDRRASEDVQVTQSRLTPVPVESRGVRPGAARQELAGQFTNRRPYLVILPRRPLQH